MNLEKLAKIFEIAVKDDEENLKVLKKMLKDNDFKVCGLGVDMMLGEMSDMGLEEDCVAYWKTLGLTHLPYKPADALKS